MHKKKVYLFHLIICLILIFSVINTTSCNTGYITSEKEGIEEPAAMLSGDGQIKASPLYAIHLRKYRRILPKEDDGKKKITLTTYVSDEWKDMSEDELNGYFDQIYQILIDEGITNDMDEMEAYHIIEQWLCKNTSYDYDYLHTSFLDILKYGTVTCNGYSEMLCIMCEICGIQCYKVHGYVYMDGEDQSHAWNYVSLDGIWYWADVTFADNGRPETRLDRNLQADKTPRYFFEFPAADEKTE